MSQLANIYTYLISNRLHQRQQWRNDYEDTVKRITALRTILKNNPGYDLNSPELYESVNNYESKDAFFKKIFENGGNGISSHGQSVISGDNRILLMNDSDFLVALKNLIMDPNLQHHNDIARIWQVKLGKNNPVQTNRATAACTLDVTSTVDNGKFNQVFDWLSRKNLIPAYTGNNTWLEKNKFVVSELRKVLVNEKHYDEYWCNIFYWEMYENLANPFSLKKQLVKYGAPGTGKTYKAKEVSELQFNIWKAEYSTSKLMYNDVSKVVQFHPSYSYEDFMEGLRPVLDVNNQAQLQLVNGIFKTMCINAGKWEVDVAALMTDSKLNNKKWEHLTIKDLSPFKDNLKGDYWDFVFDNEKVNTKLVETIPPYFIIIDEINRAELSRVFGELMYCLEYRGVNGAIETQYNQLNTEDSGMIELGGNYKFFVPHNLYLIGTMNTVDRSVESFDFALRRRFRWEEVEPSIGLLKHYLQSNNPTWEGLAENLRKLNEKIKDEPLLGKDFCIGHAYLMDLGYGSNTTYSEVRKLVWEDSILPLLEEYVRGTGREREIINTFSKSFGV
jgi:5-methylcytosine-specific restriction protein B